MHDFLDGCDEMKLVFLGPPGAGKGMLAKLVSKMYNIPHLSTGDMFREEIKNETELGKSLKDLLGKGNLAPDELTINLIRNTKEGCASKTQGEVSTGWYY